jgi:hypothetical protein
MAILEWPFQEPAPQSTLQVWRDELANTKIILFGLDKAILALTQNEVKSYSVNTGQNVINATRQDLPLLIKSRQDLIKQIQELEALADAGAPHIMQAVPF